MCAIRRRTRRSRCAIWVMRRGSALKKDCGGRWSGIGTRGQGPGVRGRGARASTLKKADSADAPASDDHRAGGELHFLHEPLRGAEFVLRVGRECDLAVMDVIGDEFAIADGDR